VASGPAVAAGEPGAERSDSAYRDVVLERRLRQALAGLNPDLPPEAVEDAYRKLTRVDGPSLLARNRAIHRMLVDGVAVEYRRSDGSIEPSAAAINAHIAMLAFLNSLFWNWLVFVLSWPFIS